MQKLHFPRTTYYHSFRSVCNDFSPPNTSPDFPGFLASCHRYLSRWFQSTAPFCSHLIGFPLHSLDQIIGLDGIQHDAPPNRCTTPIFLSFLTKNWPQGRQVQIELTRIASPNLAYYCKITIVKTIILFLFIKIIHNSSILSFCVLRWFPSNIPIFAYLCIWRMPTVVTLMLALAAWHKYNTSDPHSHNSLCFPFKPLFPVI